MTAPVALGILASITGTMSAVFWWRSAARPIPPPQIGFGGTLGKDDNFMPALTATARDNRIAAAFSGLTAILTVLSTVAQMCASP